MITLWAQNMVGTERGRTKFRDMLHRLEIAREALATCTEQADELGTHEAYWWKLTELEAAVMGLHHVMQREFETQVRHYEARVSQAKNDRQVNHD